jgi:hypothetical protein
MGVYSDYLDMQMDFNGICEERKRILNEISILRGRDVFVFASDLMKPGEEIQICYNDLLPFNDLISDLGSAEIDIILETPGGFAEIAEDLINLLHSRFTSVSVIIPGYAKSAGTIFAMGCHEILMLRSSSLGPIDAQIQVNGNVISAGGFLSKFEEISDELDKRGSIPLAYIPMLQNINPGFLKSCENAQALSSDLVTRWLKTYKFKDWNETESGKIVDDDYKTKRASEIANALKSDSIWFSHGRSIKIEDLFNLGLRINDISEYSQLEDLISRYYALMRMTFGGNVFKYYETPLKQIYRISGLPVHQEHLPANIENVEVIDIDYECPNCKKIHKIQANLDVHKKIKGGFKKFPKNNILICENCRTQSNLAKIRQEIEENSKKRIVD